MWVAENTVPASTGDQLSSKRTLHHTPSVPLPLDLVSSIQSYWAFTAKSVGTFGVCSHSDENWVLGDLFYQAKAAIGP